jgi:hypothetical protein
MVADQVAVPLVADASSEYLKGWCETVLTLFQ